MTTIESLNKELIGDFRQRLHLEPFSRELREATTKISLLASVEEGAPEEPVYSLTFDALRQEYEENKKIDFSDNGIFAKMVPLADSIDELLYTAGHVHRNDSLEYQLKNRAREKATTFKKAFRVALATHDSHYSDLDSISKQKMCAVGTLEDWYWVLLFQDETLRHNYEVYDFLNFAKEQFLNLLEKAVLTTFISKIPDDVDKLVYFLKTKLGPSCDVQLDREDYLNLINIASQNGHFVGIIPNCGAIDIYTADLFGDFTKYIYKIIKGSSGLYGIPEKCVFSLRENP